MGFIFFIVGYLFVLYFYFLGIVVYKEVLSVLVVGIKNVFDKESVSLNVFFKVLGLKGEVLIGNKVL